MAIEQCTNCGCTLGELEEAHVYKDRVVCAACRAKLSAPPPVPAKASPAAPVVQHIYHQARSNYFGWSVLTMILYFVFWLPGLIVNLLALVSASGERSRTGQAPDNTGCLWMLLVFFGAGPIVVAALMFLGVISMFAAGSAVHVSAHTSTPAPSPVAAPAAPKTITIYTARKDMVCATDPDFLNSSALMSPANFVRVKKGTELLCVGSGGVFSHLYFKMTNGTQAVYVYREQFDSDFDTRDVVQKP